MGRDEAVELTDAFLREPKTLSGSPPEFGPWKKLPGGPMRTANWPLADASGIVRSGRISVNYSPSSQKSFTIATIFREECVCRIDFVDQATCHSNPLWAQLYGLPPSVCGPHFHPWGENRRHILEQDVWSLPCRIPLQPQIRRFEQAFAWLADQINLALTDEQRLFSPPQELV